MEEQVKAVRALLVKAERVAALTGAGISAGSKNLLENWP